MKQLLCFTLSLCCYCGFAQQATDIQKLLRKYTVEKKQSNTGDTFRVIMRPSDSLRNFDLNFYKDVMPNAIKLNSYSPNLIGNNGKGQNVYILPLDKMPMIKPDSSYSSNMPIAGRIP
jgi:hypothetical protein